MKTVHYIVLAVIFLTLANCKKRKMGDQVTNNKVQTTPNGSDIKFAEALKFIENGQLPKASKRIKEGIAELNKEAENINKSEKQKLDSLNSHLNKVSNDLENGKAVQINLIRNLIANAEIIANHSYLSSDDLLIWEDPDAAEINTTSKRFDVTFANLKNTERTVKQDAQKDHKDLVMEGEKLKADYNVWEKRTVEFNKKVNDHFKKNFQEFSYLN
ncbi:hypothetical protein QGN23_06280 [Chryseobacterium gotjawalense]|uniref:DUF4142 domain-containing protein n=1 Tax=Chryseobacterium gotjawalense TaxID=3042315 RepID=A0ABY8RI65_9FLAO|nr:hypothetical protein [Chryseobacterium sp. wdc7]WHF52884.1 hypothetical protein QGN23_06280 [Chryseobacterium sp. wdc7]